MAQNEESSNNKVYEKYLEAYFPPPSNQRDCLMAIAQEAWGFVESLEDYDEDYIQELKEIHLDFAQQDLIELHSETKSKDSADIKVDKLKVYAEVDTHIREDLYDWRNGFRNFIEAFYRQKEKVVELIKDNFALNNVCEVISILETLYHKLAETMTNYEESMCYAVSEGDLGILEKHFGKNAIKHYKKWDELTAKDYESAFEDITTFMEYVNEGKFSFRLEELASRLSVICRIKMDDSEKEGPKTRVNQQRPITLIKFMQKHCEKQKIQLLRYRRKSLNDANIRGAIKLPEATRDWRTGQAKYYNPSDLKQKWPEYCEVIPNLPLLK